MAHRFSWKSKGSKVDKPWGEEECFSAPWGTCGKILHIEKGHRTSLKAYMRKDEILYLYRGKVDVLHGNDDQDMLCPYEDWKHSELLPGETILIQAGCPYRITAIEDSMLIEVTHGAAGAAISAKRFEDDYGRITGKKNN